MHMQTIAENISTAQIIAKEYVYSSCYGVLGCSSIMCFLSHHSVDFVSLGNICVVLCDANSTIISTVPYAPITALINENQKKKSRVLLIFHWLYYIWIIRVI